MLSIVKYVEQKFQNIPIDINENGNIGHLPFRSHREKLCPK